MRNIWITRYPHRTALLQESYLLIDITHAMLLLSSMPLIA